jgi:hypothetical protein
MIHKNNKTLIEEKNMLELVRLCEKINMPWEVTEIVLSINQTINFSAFRNSTDKLLSRATWKEGLEELKKVFAEDTNGFKMLTCMLVCGLATHDKYLEKGISEDIFYDTFGCFSRFVKEHKASYDCYGFDREWWTVRQIAMEEFRIGALEFEFDVVKDHKVISVHIPSDVKLSKENSDRSYAEAREFLAKYYPEYKYDNFACDSWLLSPNLKEVLDPNSQILQFQSDFQIESVNPDATDYMEWVFKNRGKSLEEVPQDTSLQRKMKAYLKSDGKIGTAFGYLKESKII